MLWCTEENRYFCVCTRGSEVVGNRPSTIQGWVRERSWTGLGFTEAAYLAEELRERLRPPVEIEIE